MRKHGEQKKFARIGEIGISSRDLEEGPKKKENVFVLKRFVANVFSLLDKLDD